MQNLLVLLAFRRSAASSERWEAQLEAKEFQSARSA